MKSHKSSVFTADAVDPVHLLRPGRRGAGGQNSIEHGRYLIVTGGCNDCHTPGYPESGGKTPQAEWLTGNAVGFQGPWGTTYPANLRLTVQKMSEAQWLARARQPMRPPMPGSTCAT